MEPTRLKDLIRLFGVLKDLHGQLLVLIQLKMDAMRRADLAVVNELNQREQAMVRRLEEREGLRRPLMDSIGAELGLPSRAARELTVSQLAARLSEPARRSLVDAANELRAVVAQVARLNRVAGAFTRDVMNHLKWVFASVRPKEDGPSGYTGMGVAATAADLRIFEAVG